MIANIQIIHLADHEWGNELMEQAARQHFLDHDSLDHDAPAPADRPVLVVEVHEHAGWYLTFIRDEAYGGLVIIGTANDGACLSARAREFARSVTKINYLPPIRRPNKEPLPCS